MAVPLARAAAALATAAAGPGVEWHPMPRAAAEPRLSPRAAPTAVGFGTPQARNAAAAAGAGALAGTWAHSEGVFVARLGAVLGGARLRVVFD